MEPYDSAYQAEVEHARRGIRDRFGAEMAVKASDGFCLAFGRGTSTAEFLGVERGPAEGPSPGPSSWSSRLSSQT
jgi:hypothetical protein